MTRDDVPPGGGPGDAGGRWDAMGCMWWWWIIIILLIIIIIWWFFSRGRAPLPAPLPDGGTAAPVYRAPAEPGTGTDGGVTTTPRTTEPRTGEGTAVPQTDGGTAAPQRDTVAPAPSGGAGTGGTMDSPNQEPQPQRPPPSTQPANGQGTSGGLSPYLMPRPALGMA